MGSLVKRGMVHFSDLLLEELVTRRQKSSGSDNNENREEFQGWKSKEGYEISGDDLNQEPGVRQTGANIRNHDDIVMTRLEGTTSPKERESTDKLFEPQCRSYYDSSVRPCKSTLVVVDFNRANHLQPIG